MPTLTGIIGQDDVSLLLFLLHIFTLSNKSAWPRSPFLL